jgi:hypothetical protein
MFRINYDIEKFKGERIGLFKHKYIYRVYKNVRGDHSISSRKLFEGSYNKCKEYCIINNINLREVIIK